MNYSNVIWVFVTFSGKKVSRSLKVKVGGLFIYGLGHLRFAWTCRDVCGRRTVLGRRYRPALYEVSIVRGELHYLGNRCNFFILCYCNICLVTSCSLPETMSLLLHLMISYIKVISVSSVKPRMTKVLRWVWVISYLKKFSWLPQFLFNPHLRCFHWF